MLKDAFPLPIEYQSPFPLQASSKNTFADTHLKEALIDLFGKFASYSQSPLIVWKADGAHFAGLHYPYKK